MSDKEYLDLPILFLLFAVLPILEIALLVNIGGAIGGWNTIAIVIFTAFLGAYLVKREGTSTLQTAQSKMQRNELPGSELVQGLMLVVAGVLLVTPGFITDVFGFLLVLPGSRHAIAAQVSKHMKMRVVTSQTGFQQQQSPFQHQSNPFENASHGDVIDGEYTDTTKNDPNKRIE